MTILEELKQLTKDYKTKETKVIDEISNFFKEYLESEQFIKDLRQKIGENEIKESKFAINIRFWEYRDGCSPTHYGLGSKEWKIPNEEESKYYKDVRLKDVQHSICYNITKFLKEKMQKLGFIYLTYENKSNALELANIYYIFGW